MIRFAVVGHIDHGKSTLIGRMLFDSGSLPKEKIAEINRLSSKENRFAHFLDYFKEERQKQMTVDTTEAFFNRKEKEYAIIDCPGHKEFIKNMVTGASSAKTAVLIIDASQGLKEQTKRHAYLLSLMGIEKIIVCINKMDLINYKKHVYEKLCKEIREFLNKLKITVSFFIPVSALNGENIFNKSRNMAWYKGPLLIKAIDKIAFSVTKLDSSPIVTIQDTYSIGSKVIAAARIVQGSIKNSYRLKALPQKKIIKINSIERFGEKPKQAKAGDSIGITTDKNFSLKRGAILCSPKKELPLVKKFKAHLFVLEGKIKKIQVFSLKCATQEVKAYISSIKEVIDSSTLKTKQKNAALLNFLDVGKVEIKTRSPIVARKFSQLQELGRFVVTKNGNIVAAGIVTDEK